MKDVYVRKQQDRRRSGRWEVVAAQSGWTVRWSVSDAVGVYFGVADFEPSDRGLANDLAEYYNRVAKAPDAFGTYQPRRVADHEHVS